MTRETKLGIFVLIGIFSFALAILLLGDFQFQRRYHINILFNNIAGLPERAKVRIAGVDVGAVEKITLQGDKAKVMVWIKHGIQIHSDTQASIVATGIIGSKYLELTMGSPSCPVLQNGDTVVGIEPIQFDKVVQEVMNQLDTVVSNFRGPEIKNTLKNLSASMENVKAITGSLKYALADQEEKLRETIDNVHSFTRDMAEITSDNKENIRIAITEIKKTATRLDSLLCQLEQGEGTIGKLVSDKEMGQDLKQTFQDLKDASVEAKRVLRRINYIEARWDYTLRYDTREKLGRSDVGIQILPRPDRFYFLGVSNVGDGNNPGETSKPDTQAKNTVNFLIGRKYAPMDVAAGVVRSKGGFVVAARPFWQWNPLRRLELTAQVYDFSRLTPVAKPQINLGARVPLSRVVYVGAQVEDIYDTSDLNVYANVNFRDEDIGYILGLVGLARP